MKGKIDTFVSLEKIMESNFFATSETSATENVQKQITIENWQGKNFVFAGLHQYFHRDICHQVSNAKEVEPQVLQ